MYHEVTDPSICKNEDDGAKVVFRRLCKKVEEDDNIYEKFVIHIRENYDSSAKKTIAILDEQYKQIYTQGMNRYSVKE